MRCAQLDKEASELRLENETLLRAVEDGKHAAVQSAQVGILLLQPLLLLPVLPLPQLAAACRAFSSLPASPAQTPLALPALPCSLRRWRRERRRCRTS